MWWRTTPTRVKKPVRVLCPTGLQQTGTIHNQTHPTPPNPNPSMTSCPKYARVSASAKATLARFEHLAPRALAAQKAAEDALPPHELSLFLHRAALGCVDPKAATAAFDLLEATYPGLLDQLAECPMELQHSLCHWEVPKKEFDFVDHVMSLRPGTLLGAPKYAAVWALAGHELRRAAQEWALVLSGYSNAFASWEGNGCHDHVEGTPRPGLRSSSVDVAAQAAFLFGDGTKVDMAIGPEATDMGTIVRHTFHQYPLCTSLRSFVRLHPEHVQAPGRGLREGVSVDVLPLAAGQPPALEACIAVLWQVLVPPQGEDPVPVDSAGGLLEPVKVTEEVARELLGQRWEGDPVVLVGTDGMVTLVPHLTTVAPSPQGAFPFVLEQPGSGRLSRPPAQVVEQPLFAFLDDPLHPVFATRTDFLERFRTHDNVSEVHDFDLPLDPRSAMSVEGVPLDPSRLPTWISHSMLNPGCVGERRRGFSGPEPFLTSLAALLALSNSDAGQVYFSAAGVSTPANAPALVVRTPTMLPMLDRALARVWADARTAAASAAHIDTSMEGMRALCRLPPAARGEKLWTYLAVLDSECKLGRHALLVALTLPEGITSLTRAREWLPAFAGLCARSGQQDMSTFLYSRACLGFGSPMPATQGMCALLLEEKKDEAAAGAGGSGCGCGDSVGDEVEPEQDATAVAPPCTVRPDVPLSLQEVHVSHQRLPPFTFGAGVPFSFGGCGRAVPETDAEADAEPESGAPIFVFPSRRRVALPSAAESDPEEKADALTLLPPPSEVTRSVAGPCGLMESA